MIPNLKSNTLHDVTIPCYSTYKVSELPKFQIFRVEYDWKRQEEFVP